MSLLLPTLPVLTHPPTHPPACLPAPHPQHDKHAAVGALETEKSALMEV